ncbi:MAG: MFS transporter [Clostridia bacterium]|nr:MFS transporter [Clostridia bacterium]
MDNSKFIPRDFLRNNYLKLGFACFMCYMGCYAGKTILSAISPFLQTNGVFNADQIGSMGMALFLAYGAGQLVNGTLGDIISPKVMAFMGIMVSGVLVILIPSIPGYALNMAVWAVIGFFCSMMWGPLTKIVAENSTGDTGRRLMLALNASLVAGTLMAYLIASVVSANFKWQVAFYVAGGYMLMCGTVFYTVVTYLEKRKIIVCAGIKSRGVKRAQPKEKLSFGLMMKHALIPTVVYCMMNGFIRNAVSFWIPTYIKEVYKVSDSFAAAITIILPIVNFIGTFLGIKMLKARIFRKSEHILSAMLFSLSTLTFALIVMFNGASLTLTLICLVLASASMNSVCNLIYAVYVFRYRDTGRISTFSGALDCSAYIASGFGTKFIGFLQSSFGWNVTVLVWCGMALLGGASCAASSIICRKNGVEANEG